MAVVGALLVAGAAANRLAIRFGLPSLLAFLLIGMLAGSDGIGGIWFDDAHRAETIGTIALAIILFSGGLEADWRHIKPIIRPGLSLATIGVVLSTGVMCLFSRYVLGLTWGEAALVGAVISSTDAAAVFGVFKTSGLKIRDELAGVLEFESGSNDPIAVFMTLGLTEILSGVHHTAADMILDFVLEMAIGTLVGYVVGRATAWLVSRFDLGSAMPVATCGAALLAFGGAASIRGNGFLAVYIAGLTLSAVNFPQRKPTRRFHDNLSWLMQISLFLTLGLLVFPSRLPGVAVAGIAIALVLAFVARPLATFVSLGLSEFNAKEKVFISWGGLRGAVPIVLATYPLLAKLPKSEWLFDVVFFVVLLSSLLQGTTLPWVARRLGLTKDSPEVSPA